VSRGIGTLAATGRGGGEAAVNDDCLKLTTYFGERQRVEGRFFADVQLELFGRHELATSILMRGISGFGLKHHLRTDQLLTLSEDLPLVSVAVDARAKIEAALAELRLVGYRGLVTLERARLLRGEIGPVELPEQLHEATKLTVYVGRQERVYRAPAFAAVCDLLHRRGLDGATVFLGVDGTYHGVRTRARFFGRNADVPMMIISVGSGHAIARALPELGGLLRQPMLTLERVRVCKRDGEFVERPHELPGQDSSGVALWQKLMVYTSERAFHDGEPVHRALVRRLRGSNARGATVLRGIWGFHDGRGPHGDRFWQLGRNVPVCTVVVDTPERIAKSFDVVDELTAEHGVVTSEMVPALGSPNGPEPPGDLRLARHWF
jgi:PII-like signaling protein